jgi:hypothetical protein
LKPGPELEKARREVAAYEQFRDLVGQVTELNEAICVARPAGPGAGSGDLSGTGGEKGGLWAGLAQEKAAERGRLAAEAARVLGCGGAGGGGRMLGEEELLEHEPDPGRAQRGELPVG